MAETLRQDIVDDFLSLLLLIVQTYLYRCMQFSYLVSHAPFRYCMPQFSANNVYGFLGNVYWKNKLI